MFIVLYLRYGGVQRGRTKNTLKKLGQLFLLHLFMPFLLVYAFFSLVRGFDLLNYSGISNTKLMTIWNHLHVPVVSYIVDLFNFFVLCSVMIWTCVTITDSYADTSAAEVKSNICLLNFSFLVMHFPSLSHVWHLYGLYALFSIKWVCLLKLFDWVNKYFNGNPSYNG